MLEHLIPAASTREFLRRLYRVNAPLAQEVAWAIYEGVLIDMGPVEHWPEGLDRPGQLTLESQAQLELDI